MGPLEWSWRAIGCIKAEDHSAIAIPAAFCLPPLFTCDVTRPSLGLLGFWSGIKAAGQAHVALGVQYVKRNLLVKLKSLDHLYVLVLLLNYWNLFFPLFLRFTKKIVDEKMVMIGHQSH